MLIQIIDVIKHTKKIEFCVIIFLSGHLIVTETEARKIKDNYFQLRSNKIQITLNIKTIMPQKK
jgi:hypothetical protein